MFLSLKRFLSFPQIRNVTSDRKTGSRSISRASLPNKFNDDKLKQLKNCHKGQRAVIVGNGPSLNVSDLDRIKNEITFASNKIYLAFDSTDWRPTYLTVTDCVVASNIKKFLRETEICKIFGHATHQHFEDAQDITFGNPPSAHFHPLEWDLLKGVKTGHSVLYWDLELAFWMGIREIYAIGLDFSFEVKSKPTGEKAMGNDVLVSSGEANHFHPDYRPAGETWTMPKLDQQRKEFEQALEKYQSDHGMIYNASRKTKLDVWPRVDFDTIFGATS